MLPVAVDAMGGDRAPDEIVAGARRAAEGRGLSVVLVGRPGELGDIGDLEVIAASEVIAMDADPGSSVRQMKDSSLIRAAEAVRDGVASAMVSAGNTGAAMASALLRMGRIRGVARPAIATLLPAPGTTPTVLLDAGARIGIHGNHLRGGNHLKVADVTQLAGATDKDNRKTPILGGASGTGHNLVRGPVAAHGVDGNGKHASSLLSRH